MGRPNFSVVAEIAPRRPRILIDFDDTIAEYHGFVGHGTIQGGPLPGALEWLASLMPMFEVVIFSTRAAQVAGVIAIHNWFRDHWPETLPACLDGSQQLRFKITAEKLPALIVFDDRALRFTGSGRYPLPEDLMLFQTWSAGELPLDQQELKYTDDLYRRRNHLRSAARSYVELAEHASMRPSWRARLRQLGREAEDLADAITQTLPPPAPAA